MGVAAVINKTVKLRIGYRVAGDMVGVGDVEDMLWLTNSFDWVSWSRMWACHCGIFMGWTFGRGCVLRQADE